MSTNREYRRWFRRDFDGLFESRRSLRAEAQVLYVSRLEAERKRRQPRRRVHFDPLPEDVVEEIKQSVFTDLPMLNELDFLIGKAQKRREDKLNELIDGVEFNPQPFHWRKVDESDAATWATQGFGCNKYARESLRMGEMRLEMLGFEFSVYRWLRHETRGNYWPGAGYLEGQAYYCFELWANCTDWQFDAVQRAKLTSFADWVEMCDKHGVNIKVYNPFIKPELEDRAREAYRRARETKPA